MQMKRHTHTHTHTHKQTHTHTQTNTHTHTLESLKFSTYYILTSQKHTSEILNDFRKFRFGQTPL